MTASLWSRIVGRPLFFHLTAFVLFMHTAAPLPAGTLSLKSFDEKASSREPVHVVFFGGSLTWGANASNPETTSYRGLMMRYLREKYPRTPITFHDAAIGGTGSQLGLFRLDRDVLAYKPDLVFLDFTVNDDLATADVPRLAAYERLVRDILSANSMILPVLMGVKSSISTPDDSLPERHQAHLKIAEAYHLPVANIVTALRAKTKAGACDPFKLWNIGTDTTHPGDEGYRLFFEAVRDAFEQGLKESTPAIIPKQTVFPDLYPKRHRQILVNAPLPQGWQRTHTYRTSLWFDGLSSRWMTDVAQAISAKNPAPLEVTFDGAFVALFGERNGFTPPIKIWIDGKPITKEGSDLWKLDTSRISPPSKGNGNLFLWQPLSSQLSDGKHTLRIEPVFDGLGADSELHLESICSAGK